jgi:hypothetical protein
VDVQQQPSSTTPESDGTDRLAKLLAEEKYDVQNDPAEKLWEDFNNSLIAPPSTVPSAEPVDVGTFDTVHFYAKYTETP